MDIDRIKSESRGKWSGIYHNLGIEVGTRKHKSCPAPGCGGKDRFRFTDRHGNGEYYCNACGHGDGIDLIQKCLGITFIEAVEKISQLIGIIEMDFRPNKPKKDPSIYLNKVWNSSVEIENNDPVSRYLRSRGIEFIPKDVRYCPECWESDTKQNYQSMVARITSKAGKPIGLHVTYLKDGKKADIPSPKKMMTATESLKGSAIRLAIPENNTLGISEGVESALSASKLFNMPVWACMSSVLLESWEPPEKIKFVIICGDSDKSFSGEKSAYILANRLYKDYYVEVRIPKIRGQDWNNVVINKA